MDTINKKRGIIIIFLILFLLFFFLKLNGFFDYTKNYGIERIEANKDGEHVMALIDNEEETVWGDNIIWEEPLSFKGEGFTVYFYKEREIKEIILKGEIPESINISLDGRETYGVKREDDDSSHFFIGSKDPVSSLNVTSESEKEGGLFYVSELIIR